MDDPILSITIPFIPYFSNIVVFPLPRKENCAKVFILKKTADVPEASNEKFRLEYLPGHVYCLLPSKEMQQGQIFLCKSRPNSLKQFSYCLEMDKKYISFSKTTLGLDNADFQNIKKESHFGEIKSEDCKGCFIYHFPRPNKRLCKGRKLLVFDKKTKSYPVHLHGGAADEEVGGILSLRERAIYNASFHGISLHLGVENLANGNCAFETVLDSLNTRDCFEDKFVGTPDYWRQVWMSEVERVAYKDWRGNLSYADWHEGWSVLKKTKGI